MDSYFVMFYINSFTDGIYSQIYNLGSIVYNAFVFKKNNLVPYSPRQIPIISQLN